MKNDNSVNLFLGTVKYLKIVFHLKFSINVNIFIIINWLSAYFFFAVKTPYFSKPFVSRNVELYVNLFHLYSISSLATDISPNQLSPNADVRSEQEQKDDFLDKSKLQHK